MSDNHNQVIQSLRHMTQKFDELGSDMLDFNRNQANGESQDPSAFTEMLKKQSITRSAMTAQFSLLQKPLKTVLNEAK